ncbi:hypothetical protein [Actinomadura parmotrematis]|uniref:Integral membrane protein n=1 Tax=Actinomadura parmotrematis TaxID=2864039 RepID=A0ABS7FS47_9ACTN|nr:hypothetical protein [Actinomadura parmotrematis]MBW8483131.1 hypothetical protein [Actinomadura parmotrematis]
MGEWFRHDIVDGGRLRLFCFLTAFVCAFLFIRFSVRMIRRQVSWWPGNVTPGGHHIHHVVFGLVFMCVGGIGGLVVPGPDTFAAGLLAALFGVGTALVLDEFALVLHLSDVYWSEQGRLSVQVVFIAVALSGLALLGLRPLGLADLDGAGGVLQVWSIALTLLLNLAFATVTLLKGKVWTGLLGLFVGVFSIVGAIRLARPASPWARWRYRPGTRRGDRKLARAAARERRWRAPVQRFTTALGDAVAGRPTPPAPVSGEDPSTPPDRP